MYVDSGSGSMIVQAAVAGAVGASVVVKVAWRRMSGGLRGSRKPSVADVDGPPQLSAPEETEH